MCNDTAFKYEPRKSTQRASQKQTLQTLQPARHTSTSSSQYHKGTTPQMTVCVVLHCSARGRLLPFGVVGSLADERVHHAFTIAHPVREDSCAVEGRREIERGCVRMGKITSKGQDGLQNTRVLCQSHDTRTEKCGERSRAGVMLGMGKMESLRTA